ncbi:outer membrane beta-barrel protein [Bdellovibrio svalbardensis]|uniref:Outer membrane protein beta-barrel domain-containing protein n=1 Tax=Bdellovibrio svalbardensis TaxID=2972972 RepID=A0ABT6DG90_9BACT|nr:outer membrane beta-barrel protein [Bdellovibrio svalbardensis]MDG0815857.1 hypothetical protein [Bdellovibrio svalbardensis]
MNKLLISLALILGFSGVAHANIMIEPYLGYETGKNTDPDGKTSGTVIGGRLAYKAPVMFWAGLDGAFETGTNKPDSNALTNSDFKRTTLYAVVGVDLPILFRVWAGYGFSDELKLETTPSMKGTGTNYKFGLGFTALPFVSLNAEYIKGKLTGGDIHDNFPDAQNESVVLSVSLPLVF